MKKIAFYSWQSDLPNGTNRTLIEDVLQEVAKKIFEDNETEIEPVIDRDTQGVSGAPNIATAIFNKIDSADVFVADVSIVGKAKKRPTPNPNVLIELGYALKSKGHEKIILVFNTAFGKIENLPFDLRMHRTLTYECSELVKDRSEIKKRLAKDLKVALTMGFSHFHPQPKINVLDIIKENKPSKKIDIRSYLSSLLKELDALQPKTKQDGGTVEDLLLALPDTEKIVSEFCELSETITLMNDLESAKEVFQWFGKILTRYDPIVKDNGPIWNCNGDFFKFLGHEMFVCFISSLLKEEKWTSIGKLLREKLKVGPTENHRSERSASWTEISRFSPLLEDEGKKKGRMSFHADLLRLRHEKEIFSEIMPMKDFTSTDLFLHFFGPGKTIDAYGGEWYPRSDVWIKENPRFIIESEDYRTAMEICNTLQISDVEEFKKRLNLSRVKYDWRPPYDEEDIKKIGSHGGAQIIT